MPANTPRGLPYPLPTEPVAEGAAAIRALAEAGDAKTGMFRLQNIGAGAGAAIDFPGISQAYEHLLILGNLRALGSSNAEIGIEFNGVASASYEYASAVSKGGAAPYNSSGAAKIYGRLGEVGGVGVVGSEMISLRVEIPNYRSTTQRKSWIYQSGGYESGGVISEVGGGRFYFDTAAITRVRIYLPVGALLDSASRATLYGLT